MEFRNNSLFFNHWCTSVFNYLYNNFYSLFSFHSLVPKEVARQTIFQLVPYPTSKWSKVSPEAKEFVMCIIIVKNVNTNNINIF